MDTNKTVQMLAEGNTLADLMHNAEMTIRAIRLKLGQPQAPQVVVSDEGRFVGSESLGGAMFVWTYNDVCDVQDTTLVCATLASHAVGKLLEVHSEEHDRADCHLFH